MVRRRCTSDGLVQVWYLHKPHRNRYVELAERVGITQIYDQAITAIRSLAVLNF